MVFSELPADAEFCFGKIKKTQYSYSSQQRTTVDIPMIWKKTALGGLSVGIKECGYATFDYRHEATGANRYMRNHGHRLFFLSSLCKYLNCADTSWKQVAAGDVQPYNNEYEFGFLSRFNEEELRLMEPHNMKVAVPQGYTKMFGAEMTKPVLVGIPSLEQIGDRYSMGTFAVPFARIDTWVSDADTMSKYMSYGSVRRIGGDRSSNIMPVIKIKDDAPVDVDASGAYVIRIPETNFSGDIDAFLGLTLVTAA